MRFPQLSSNVTTDKRTIYSTERIKYALKQQKGCASVFEIYSKNVFRITNIQYSCVYYARIFNHKVSVILSSSIRVLFINDIRHAQ